MLNKRLLSLLPLLAVLAAGLAGVAASPASAVEGTCTVNVLCGRNSAAPNSERLRDDLVEPPEGVSGGGYGASLLAVNTEGKLRLCATVGAEKPCNENPQGDAFFGVKLHSNPLTSTTKCEEAEGWVTFVDIQNATTSAVSSPVYDNTSPGYNGPWPIGIRSDHCTEAKHPGRVTIEHVALYFPVLGLQAVGNIVGQWVQPGTTGKCEHGRGGIELANEQPGLRLSPAGEKPTLDNGTTGKAAFICFVSSNNELFPEKPPTWTPLIGGIWKD